MYQDQTVTAGIFRNCEALPEHPALIYKDEVITYSRLKENALRSAKKLYMAGVRPGDRIVYSLPPSPAFFYTYLACGMIGACAAAIAYQNVSEAAAAIIAEVSPKAVVCHDDLIELYRAVSPELPILPAGELLSENLTDEDKVLFDELHNRVRPDDLLFILYTSGTTSKPKGACMTHRNVLASAYMQNTYLGHGGFSPSDVIMHSFPVNHVSGALLTGTAPLLAGAALVVNQKFHPVTYLTELVKYHGTIMCGVPTMFAMILKVLKNHPFDLSSVRACISGAAPMKPSVEKGIKAICPICENPLGMTETCGMCTFFPSDVKVNDLYNTIGRLMPELSLKLIDADGNPCKQGEIGQICIKGDSVIRQYLSLPLRFDAEGYYLSGDMGYLDENGLLRICGRNDDMFTVGGYNVYPQEVENLLSTFPGVTGAVVLPIPHESIGNVCRAYLTVSESVDVSALKTFAAQHLIYYKVPRSFKIIDKFPLNALGKVCKKDLVREIEKEFCLT